MSRGQGQTRVRPGGRGAEWTAAHLLGDRVDEPDVQVLLRADACGGGAGTKSGPRSPWPRTRNTTRLWGQRPRKPLQGSRLLASMRAEPSWGQRHPHISPSPGRGPRSPAPPRPRGGPRATAARSAVSWPGTQAGAAAARGAHRYCRAAVTCSGCRCWSSHCPVPEKKAAFEPLAFQHPPPKEGETGERTPHRLPPPISHFRRQVREQERPLPANP